MTVKGFPLAMGTHACVWLALFPATALPAQVTAGAPSGSPSRSVPLVEYVERGPVPIRLVSVRVPESGSLIETEFLVENVGTAMVLTLVFQTSWPDLTEDETGRVAPLGFVEGRPEFTGLASGPEPLLPGEKRFVKLAPGIGEALDVDFARRNMAAGWTCEVRLLVVEGENYTWVPEADPDAAEARNRGSCKPSRRTEVPVTLVPSKRAASGL